MVRTRITSNGASQRGASLGRRVIHLIPSTVTPALERVNKAEPMASLMNGRLAEIKTSGRTTRDGCGQDGAAVADEGVGPGGGAGGIVAVAEGAARVIDKVHVEGRVGTLAESGLHGHLVAVLGPHVVDGLGGAGVVEGVAVGGKVSSQDIELALEGVILYVLSVLVSQDSPFLVST